MKLPFFSIIIPVWREENQIQRQIEDLKKKLDLPYEMIVVDGDPWGSTIQKIQDAWIIKCTGKKGRAWQMNRGADLAKGDILVFLHCDTFLPLQPLRQIYQAIQKGYPCGGFRLSILSSDWRLQWIARITTWRSRFFRLPYGDQCQFFTSSLFFQIGKFPQIPIFEDFAIMKKIKSHRIPVTILRSSVQTSPRRWEKEGVWKCTFRNWYLKYLYSQGVSPAKLAQYYQDTR